MTVSPARIWRMPVHFGAPSGPRQDSEGKRFDWSDNPLRTCAAVHFRTEAAALARLLPPALEPAGNPIVTVEFTKLERLAWLAGRGYTMLGVKFPARFRGRRDDVSGLFLAVLWENLGDAIISGREELGYNKLYCQLPDPAADGASRHYSARWEGHEFFRLTLTLGEGAAAAPDYGLAANAGLLHHKYIPRTGAWGEADADYITLTPAIGSLVRRERFEPATARFAFARSTWEQLPTLHHVVNGLAALPVFEIVGASLEHAVGGKDLRDQRILV